MTVLPDLTIRVLSLGAGVQSTTLALMSIEGKLPRPDAAVFADTGWEPRAVYEHLDRLSGELERAGIPLHRVSQGNLRQDAINPDHRYASIPYFVRNPPFEVTEPIEWDACPVCAGSSGDGECAKCDGKQLVPVRWQKRPAALKEREGMGRRQCTSEYKLAPINRKVRELLGAKPPDFRRVPKGRVAEQWIGFSVDEIHRVSNRFGVSYLQARYPLIELGMNRINCERWLESRGWNAVTKSACVGCPYHGNAQWRDLRDNRPDEWADAVAFDEAIRKGGAHGLPLNGEAFLHRSRIPLAIAPIDQVTRSEIRTEDARLMGDLFDVLYQEHGEPDGCSPYGCRSGLGVEVTP